MVFNQTLSLYGYRLTTVAVVYACDGQRLSPIPFFYKLSSRRRLLWFNWSLIFTGEGDVDHSCGAKSYQQKISAPKIYRNSQIFLKIWKLRISLEFWICFFLFLLRLIPVVNQLQNWLLLHWISFHNSNGDGTQSTPSLYVICNLFAYHTCDLKWDSKHQNPQIQRSMQKVRHIPLFGNKDVTSFSSISYCSSSEYSSQYGFTITQD